MRREDPGHTLQTTALVNEAYCRLIEQKDVRWQNRAHFHGISAQLMRRILVDHARSRVRAKRGGAAQKISLDETAVIPQPQSSQMILLDDALTRLAQFDPQKSRIVELKFFGGLTTEEIAEVEQLSIRSVEREWRKPRPGFTMQHKGDMDPKRWKQIDELLDAAFELEPDKREAFLDQAASCRKRVRPPR